MSSINCPKCGEINSATSVHCAVCGHSLREKNKTISVDSQRYLVCSNCGAENSVSKKYCLSCGSSLNAAKRVETDGGTYTFQKKKDVHIDISSRVVMAQDVDNENPENNSPETNDKSKSNNTRLIILGLVLILGLLCLILTQTLGSDGDSSYHCTEYDPPYDIVFIDGEADVYGGVDEPSSSIKGNVTGGAAGKEAHCSGPNGSYYRLKGVDWWGWVKTDKTHK